MFGENYSFNGTGITATLLSGLIMAIVILYKIGAEQAEVVYSGAGIFSKLAICLGI